MKTKHSLTRIIGALAFCALAACALSTARGATTWYWDGNTATLNGQSDNATTTGENWLSGGNWDNGTADAPLSAWTAGDSAVFGGSAASQTVTAGALTIGNMTFGSGGDGSGTSGTAYTISSSTLTLSSGSTITANTPTAISSVLAGSGLSLTVGGTATLTLSGVNTYSGGTTINSGSALTIGGSGKLGNGTYAGAIANAGTFTYNSSAAQTLSGIMSGAGALVQSGSGTLTLTKANTYTGGTTINSGRTLTLGTPPSVGGTLAAGGAILNNGTLNYNNPASWTLSGIISGTGALSVNPNTTLGSQLTLTGANTYSGRTTISAAGQVIISSDSNLGTPPATFSANQLVMNYGFLKANGTFTLNANRGITMGAGSSGIGASIQVNPGFTLTLAAPITGSFGFISGSGEVTFGFGTNLLTAANTYTGPTVISTGRLMLGATGALPYGTTMVISSDDGTSPPGAIFDLGGYSQTIGPLTSTNTIYPPAGYGTGIPTIVLNGALTVLQTNATSIFAGLITGPGSFTLSGNSSGMLILSNYANTYTGGTTITGGTLDITNGCSIAGNVTVTGGTLKLDSNTALATTATLTLPSSPAAGMVNLNFTGTQTVSALYYGATPQALGTWGSLTSGADNRDAAFTGTGLLLVCPPSDQTITPAASSVCAGATTTASVTVTPGASYAWSVGNGTIISGGTASTVSYSAWAINPVTLNCVVTSSCGAVSAGGQNVNVTVNICGQVVDSTNVVYDPATGATITGAGVMGANWYLNASEDVTAPLPWATIRGGTVTVSPFTVNDPDAIYYSQRFYYITNAP